MSMHGQGEQADAALQGHEPPMAPAPTPEVATDACQTDNIVRLTLPGGARYDIRIGQGAIERLAADIAASTPHRHAAIIADSNVAPLYAPRVAQLLEQQGFYCAQLEFEAGEQAKTLAGLEQIHRALAQNRFARDAVIVALGGGVTGDLAGFAASTYMRGVPFVQVPTTLLAMVDSSVGGKNGVNVGGIKNLVGNFAQPVCVCADTSVLDTLPPLEWQCGFAEMAKSALIDSAGFSSWLFDNAPALVAHDADALRDAITKTVAFKARVVVADEHESGQRKCLNYGHTLGHAIEAIAQNPAIEHGICVAEGMRFAAYLAQGIGLELASGFAQAQDALLAALGIEPMLRRFDVDLLMQRMMNDKKADGCSLSFVLLTAPGQWAVHRLDPEAVREQLIRWMQLK